jgi:maleylacetate reductase
MLPYTTAFLAPASPAGAARAARALGGSDPAAALRDLARAIGAPTSLTEVGFDPRHIDDVAAAMGIDGIRELLVAACGPQ